MAQETRFSMQPLARGTQQLPQQWRASSLLFCPPRSYRAYQLLCPSAWAGSSEKSPLPLLISAIDSLLLLAVFFIHGQIHCMPGVRTDFSHEQFPIVVQWDSQASIYSGDTVNGYKHVIQITSISNMNDFIWFCLKSVQLMTFQVSSFYPEIDYKNLLITFFREKKSSKTTQMSKSKHYKS